MFTYNICKPDDKRRVNTDLPPLKLGGRKINNIEWAATPNMRTNNLHAIYMILCKCENDSMDRNINATGMK